MEKRQTVLVMNGHDHGDDLNIINGIPYKSYLYCIVEMEDENVKIYGTKSDYQTMAPEDVGIAGRRWNGVFIEPKISGWDRRV